MRETLRKISEMLAGVAIYLLGVEAHVVCGVDELLHQLLCFAAAAEQGERLDEPERAREERALTAVHPVVSRVPHDVRAAGTLVSNRRDGSSHALVVRLGIREQDAEKHAGVELVA